MIVLGLGNVNFFLCAARTIKVSHRQTETGERFGYAGPTCILLNITAEMRLISIKSCLLQCEDVPVDEHRRQSYC